MLRSNLRWRYYGLCYRGNGILAARSETERRWSISVMVRFSSGGGELMGSVYVVCVCCCVYVVFCSDSWTEFVDVSLRSFCGVGVCCDGVVCYSGDRDVSFVFSGEEYTLTCRGRKYGELAI